MSEMYQLINKKQALVAKCEAILDEVKTTGIGELTPEQEAVYNKHFKELKVVNALIEEELKDWRSSEPIVTKPSNQIGKGADTGIKAPCKVTGKSYKGMFYGNEQAVITNNGFNSFEDFLYTVHAGRADERLIKCSMVEGIPAFGGFAVPEEYGAFLMDASLEEEIIRPRATVWPMASENLSLIHI